MYFASQKFRVTAEVQSLEHVEAETEKKITATAEGQNVLKEIFHFL
jgi:hypothetical protein